MGESSNFQSRFKNFIEEQKLTSGEENILITVSGGVDSVVLLHLFFRAGYKISIGHVNFKLRGKDSEDDEKFVESLAKKYKVPFYRKSFETGKIAEESPGSIQMTARFLRYKWFKELALAKNITKIATAHHQDDVAETMILNLIKGSGIRGLHGIFPKRGNIIRPLLFAEKKEIIDFALKEELEWREDISNESLKYQRNLIRNKIIPAMLKINSNLIRTLWESSIRFNEVEKLIERDVDKYLQKISSKKGELVYLKLSGLENIPNQEFYFYEIFRDYGFKSTQVKEIINLLKSDSGKKVSSHSFVIVKDRDHLIVFPRDKGKRDKHYLIREGEEAFKFGGAGFKLNTEEIHGFPRDLDNRDIGFLDLSEIVYPLKMRYWQKGDNFSPLGMSTTKKLSDFFTDEKYSIPEKFNALILENGDGRIAWIAGKRIDHRFRIRPETKKVLKIQVFF